MKKKLEKTEETYATKSARLRDLNAKNDPTTTAERTRLADELEQLEEHCLNTRIRIAHVEAHSHEF